MKYILDTNVIADRMRAVEPVSTRLKQTVAAGNEIYLCKPVHYEVLRGLHHTRATTKLQIYQKTIVPLLAPLPLTDADWTQAAQFWADARKRGKQLSDVDLLLAALANRLNAVVVSADADFDALPITRENWRDSTS